LFETGCFPSYRDFTDSKYGKLVQKYVKAGSCSAEARARTARLNEWLTLGPESRAACTAAGLRTVARLVVRSLLPLEKYAQMARKLGGIKEEIPDPGK